jgi:hypothetical protein
VNPPQVRPTGKSVGFHAHQSDEALFLEDAPMAIELCGNRSTGEVYTATAYVPEAFPYLLMKLSAFAERKVDANKDLGRHHALDAYTIVGMMTEPEYNRAMTLAARIPTSSGSVRSSRLSSLLRPRSESRGFEKCCISQGREQTAYRIHKTLFYTIL